MKRTLVLLFATVVMCVFTGIFVNAQTASVDKTGTCGANLTWVLDDEGVLTISGSGLMTNFDTQTSCFYGSNKIKEIVIEPGVTSIGDYVFENCPNLTSVTIGNSVRSIGDCAFRNCTSLYSMEIPNSVNSIGVGVFNGCISLVSVSIPNSVTTISQSTFYNCKKLANLTTPNELKSIGYAAFYNCTELRSIEIPDSVTSIGGSAFRNCTRLKSIKIPDGVKSIGDYTFEECRNLVSVMVGKGITSIGNDAFYACSSLEDVYITDIGAWLKIYFEPSYAEDPKMPLYFSNPLYYAQNLYLDGELLTELIVPDGVTSIKASAFSGCRSFKSITIPDSVTSIGREAFSGCTGLESVVLGNGVKSIDTETFYGCTNLTYITLPDSVTSIGNYAFYGCTSLTSITIPDSVTSIGNYAFAGCDSLTSINVPYGVKNVGLGAFVHCTSLTSITISSSVISIGEAAFAGCLSLETVYWNARNVPDFELWYDSYFREYCSAAIFSDSGIDGPGIDFVFGDSVSNIPEYLFYAGVYSSMPKIKTVTFGKYMTHIPDKVFEDCKELTTITIPESVTSIATYAFRNCANLEKINWNAAKVQQASNIFYNAGTLGSGIEVVFGDKVRNIPNSVFYNCKNLESIVFGNNVTSIGDSAFRGCTKLMSITIPSSVTSIGDSAFYDCTNLASVSVPNGVISIGKFAFSNCKNLIDVKISDSVTIIGGHAFDNTGFYNDEVNWEDNVLYIGDHLIKASVAITGDYVIKEGTKTIAENAFADCKNLASIVIPRGVTYIGATTFSGCTNFETITIPDSVINIGECAFENCGNFKFIHYMGSKQQYNKIEIDYGNSCFKNAKLHCLVPDTPKVKAMNTIKGMKVTWNAVDGAVKYALYKRLGTETIWTYVTTTTATAYSDNNAPYAGSYYVYTVKAYNYANMTSDYIKANCASVQRVIAPYTYATNTVNGINVTWGKVAGANKYVVLRRLGTGSVWETLCTTTGTSYLDKNVTPGVYYLYSIRAVNNTGYSEYDVNKRVTIKRALYKPDTPTAVATNLANGVQVKWNSVTGATKYNVYRRVGGSSTWVLVGTTTGTSLVDKGVTNGKYYVYSIRAINSAGYSAFDTKKTVTIQPITAPIPKLVNKSNGVHVSWNAVAGATKYNVYRRAAGSSTWVYVGSATGTGGLDKGVVKGNYYAYSIRAINGTGYSAYDGSKCASIKHS